MRKLLGIGAVVLGGAGVLLCAAAIGIAWWAAVKTAVRLDRVATRLDRGLSEVDVRLARVESRVNAIRTDLDAIRGAAETITDENPNLPRVQAEIERLLDRLVPTIERADALADSLRSAAAGLRTAADIVDQLTGDPATTVRVRNATEKIDHASEVLTALRARVADSKSAKAVRLSREISKLAREAIAGSELLAEGLASARHAIEIVRGRTVEWHENLVYWIYVAATANTLVWLWIGLGQLCLIYWGRRRTFSVERPDETSGLDAKKVSGTLS